MTISLLVWQRLVDTDLAAVLIAESTLQRAFLAFPELVSVGPEQAVVILFRKKYRVRQTTGEAYRRHLVAGFP